jgi:hypothetical protein
MQITRSSIDTQKGPADWFTGDVYIDAVAAPAGSSTFARRRGALHARAHRLAHPPARPDDPRHRGRGAVSTRGRPGRDDRPGARVFFDPGENHWHGAAPNRFIVHIAMQQNDDSGSPVTRGLRVTDEEYSAAPPSAD